MQEWRFLRSVNPVFQDRQNWPGLVENRRVRVPHRSKSGIMRVYDDPLTGKHAAIQKIFGYSPQELALFRSPDGEERLSGRASVFTGEQAETLVSSIQRYERQLSTIGVIVPQTLDIHAKPKMFSPNEWLVEHTQQYVDGINLKDRLAELLAEGNMEVFLSYFSGMLNLTHTVIKYRPTGADDALFSYIPEDPLESCVAIDIKPSNFVLASPNAGNQYCAFVDLVYPGDRDISGAASYSTHMPNTGEDPGLTHLTARLSTFEGLTAKLILELASIGRTDEEKSDLYARLVQKTFDYLIDQNDLPAIARFGVIAGQRMSFYREIQGIAEQRRFKDIWKVLGQ